MRARECERVCAMHVDASERWLWSGLVCSATHIPVAREDRSTEVTAVLHLHRKSRLCLERASRLAAWRQQVQSARLVCLPTGVAAKDTHPPTLACAALMPQSVWAARLSQLHRALRPSSKTFADRLSVPTMAYPPAPSVFKTEAQRANNSVHPVHWIRPTHTLAHSPLDCATVPHSLSDASCTSYQPPPHQETPPKENAVRESR